MCLPQKDNESIIPCNCILLSLIFFFQLISRNVNKHKKDTPIETILRASLLVLLLLFCLLFVFAASLSSLVFETNLMQRMLRSNSHRLIDNIFASFSSSRRTTTKIFKLKKFSVAIRHVAIRIDSATDICMYWCLYTLYIQCI